MDFLDEVRAFAKRVTTILDKIHTEEATKNALILPLLQILGYNVFDPTEVVPEFTADVGTKKGEKVDFAIVLDGKPALLIEAKPYGDDLSEHSSQLFRYFSATSAKFAILTNGVLYRFFSDLQEPNKMDTQPFFEFNLLEAEDAQINELRRFHRENFDLAGLATAAVELKYTRHIKQAMEREMKEPSDDFVRFWLRDTYSGRVTRSVLDEFRPIVKRALNQYITDVINSRLKSAMETAESRAAPAGVPAPAQEGSEDESVVTTPEELEAVYVIKSILRKEIDPARITYRDRKAWCNVLIDDNIRRWVCRLIFDGPSKRIELHDDPPRRVTIEKIDDIYQLDQDLLRIAKRLLSEPAA